jgi:ribonuclease Y
MMVYIGLLGGAMLGISILLILYGIKKIERARSISLQAKQQIEFLKKELEAERREALLKLKDELHKRRTEFEQELHRERGEMSRLQKKIGDRAELIDKREQRVEELQHELQQKERNLSRISDQLHLNEKRVKMLSEELTARLESLSGLSREDARQALFKSLESEVYMAHEKWIQKEEEAARSTAKEKAIQIVVNAMQRYSSDQVAPHAAGVVHLPNDEMKGRIIGKEGRNIKSLEMATGMEFVIGDTPEIITISGFNPIRREIARRSLEKLIADGRINPTRIEEVVQQCEKEIDETIEEYGKKVIMDFNLQGVKSDLVQLLGKLHFRTSFSQNVLEHSIEVGFFARMIAEELGLPNPEIALRGGLFHDIGKALSAECEGPHAVIGAEVAKKCGEDPLVVNAIAAHHEETGFISVYSPIVMIADTISASRPGARRETLSTYLKRLEQLEEIAYSFDGVKKAYAIQAGREMRVIVEENSVTDERSATLAREIVRKIEKDMAFPGQIKVSVIREKRAVEYAR